ncbi:neurexin-1-like isoform X2 [Mytilus edulis]|uniref:neurexin-1-like isoform X2 n=1 Tax=Mytilus edulis TaxID=6550 RepID=UPI0039EFFDF8
MALLQEIVSALFCIAAIVINVCTAGFEIKGSEFAFVKLEEWKPCRNGSIQMEFKTTFENVLLFYTDDGGINDYFEVKLLKGKLHVVFDLGSGKMRLVAGEQLHDNIWHKVLIIRKDSYISLHVDDSTHPRKYQGKDQLFGIQNKFNNYVFVGGIAKDYEDRTQALTLPSVFFETRFNGYIRNILYSNCGGPLFRPKILESLNMTMGTKECITNSPCLHGSVCVEEDNGVSCDCSSTNFRGDKCEIEKTPTEVTLLGTQYLMYNFVKDNNTDDGLQSNEDEIDLYFRTQQPDGLLFFIGDMTDHIIITLRNGGVFVRVNLGSGPWEELLPANGYRFDDNQWHHLVVKRKSREIHVEVDGSHRLDGTTLGSYVMLHIITLYVGGGPSPLYKNRPTHNFKGCLKKVVYSSNKISMDITTMAMDGQLTVFGDVLFNQCQDMVESQPVTFTTPDSYIVLPRWEVGIHGGSISFTFQTNELSGVLMYNHGLTNLDFFAFEILDGYLNFLINLGSGTEKVKMKYISDGKPHSVSLHHAGKNGHILLDGNKITYALGGDSNHLDLDSKLYVGGIDRSIQQRTMPTGIWAAILSNGFVGCLHDLVMNGNKIDLITAARKQMISTIKDFCKVMEPQCNQGSCLHHGVCHEGWNRYMCDCRGTDYTGPICQKGATTLEFNGNQFLKITMDDTSITEAEDISLRFRTTHKNGLLFITSSDDSPDKMELYLESGSVKLDIKIGQSSKALSFRRLVNDDRWHTVYLKRRGEIIQLKLDENPYIEENLVEKTLNIKQIVLGSVSPMLSDEYIHSESDFTKSEITRMQQEDNILRRHTGYIGAMQQFIFNNNHFFDLAKSRKMENIEVTAKFDTENPVLIDPVTFKSKDAYVILSPLNANTPFSIYLKFKTTEADGLILFNGGRQDFLALELQDGNLHYIYNTGNGARRIFVNTRKKLNDNLWHDVSLIRTSVERQLIRVDDNPPTMEDMNDLTSVHFNLDNDLYIGGVKRTMFNTLPSRISSRHGFQGCLASIDLNGFRPNLYTLAGQNNNGIAKNCQGPSSGCKSESCRNHGRCVPHWNSYTCDCDMTSFSGPTCVDESVSFSFGRRGGLITYERPKGKYYDTTEDQFALGFATSQLNACLFRVESENSKDFIEFSLNMGNILIYYNMGTQREIPIGEMLKTFNDRKYHVVRFKRSGSNATLTIDDDKPIVKIPDIHKQRWNIFNNQARIYIGGMKRNKGRLEKTFHGTISGLVFNGLPLLEKAAEGGDRRISIEGDVRLKRREVMQSTRETRKIFIKKKTFRKDTVLNNNEINSIVNTKSRIDKREITNDNIDYDFSIILTVDDEDDVKNTHIDDSSGDSVYIPLREEDPAITLLPQINQFKDISTVETDVSLHVDSIHEVIPIANRPMSPTTISNKLLPDPAKYPKDRGREQSIVIDGTDKLNIEISPVQTTPMQGVPDEIIVSTEDGLECMSDDEDECVTFSGAGSADDIILPTSTIITFSTPKPPETPQPRYLNIYHQQRPHQKIQPIQLDTHRPSTLKNMNRICEGGAEGCIETSQPNILVTTLRTESQGPPDREDDKKKLALFIGIGVGVAFTVIILIIALYKFRSRDEGTYKVDESKNFAYLESKSLQGNGAIIGASNIKPGKKKDVKEWYV